MRKKPGAKRKNIRQDSPIYHGDRHQGVTISPSGNSFSCTTSSTVQMVRFLTMHGETHVNRQWRRGHAMSSTVTLPSEEALQDGKERRHSRMDMSGLRDMLRSLKWGHSGQPLPPPASTTPLSIQSSKGSQGQHHYPHARLPQSRLQRNSNTSILDQSQYVTLGFIEQSDSSYSVLIRTISDK